MAFTPSEPSPGHENTVSVTKAPPTKLGIDNPKIVMIGINTFRST